jgi:hypothetical protein
MATSVPTPPPGDHPGAPGLPELPESGRRARLQRTARGLSLTATAAASSAATTAARVAGVSGRRAWDTLQEVLPRVPVRDLATLRAQHGGLEGEELADALVRGAAASVMSVGVAGGMALVAERKVPAWFVAIPVTLATEAVLVAAIEAKLIAELHEVYGVPLRPATRSRGAAVVAEWANRRDIDPMDPRSLRVVAGLAVRQRGVRRVAGGASRATRFGTAFVGGVAGAATHRRNLGELADEVRADLRTSRRNRVTRTWPW